MKIVEVIWDDAALESCHMGLEEAASIVPMHRSNVGYLLKRDKDKIVVAFGEIEDLDHKQKVYDQTLVIPRNMVKEIREL